MEATIIKQTDKFKLFDYSEKAVALVGETRDYKDKLKTIGGKFNPSLRCGAGWVFPKKKMEELVTFINSIK